jgi:phospholipase A1
MTDDRRPAAAPRTTTFACLALCAVAASAQPAGSGAAACAAIADDRARLECYDRAAGRGVAPAAAPAAPAAPLGGSTPPPPGTWPGAPLPTADGPPLPVLDDRAKLARDERRALGSTLGERWELDPGNKQGRFLLRPYKPMYVLPIRWTDSPNQTPTSPSEGRSVAEGQGLQDIEAVFQISLKSKVWETIGGSNVDLWVAYTQQSFWQVYNASLSRPFRETNYEPEVFAIWGFDQPLFLGWRARFMGLGINHQSNGRAEPLSRSWNRVIAQFGFENGDWSLQARPWWRIKEQNDDDNPFIERYVGQGELILTRKVGAHIASLQVRHSLRGGDESRGSAQLGWSFPVSSFLKGYLKVFSGYGESLIDYNHRQTTIGFGVSLADWL